MGTILQPVETSRPLRGALVAGGRGTRLAEVAGDLPKPLLPLDGRPLLGLQARLLAEAGIPEAAVLAGWQWHKIEERMAELTPDGLRLRLVVEDRPRGSGGCLELAPWDDATLVVLFGDVAADLDVAALVAFHRQRGGVATAVVHPNDHPHDSDLVETDAHHRIVRLHKKPHPPGLAVPNLVTAGVFVIEPELLRQLPEDEPADLVHDLLAPAVAAGQPIYAYRTAEYLKDMGTPERWARVREDFARGRPAALRKDRLRPAAFLDRDGTLIRHVELLTRTEELELLPGAARAVQRLNRAGIWTVLATNQPVVARGLVTEEELARIHHRLEMLLGEQGAYLDAVYYCPHHPDRGFAGEVVELKGPCSCRKPEPGMLEQAARDLPLDLDRSALFGDTWRDLEAARRAGVHPYLLRTGPEEPPPEVESHADLEQAVDAWLATGVAPVQLP